MTTNEIDDLIARQIMHWHVSDDRMYWLDKDGSRMADNHLNVEDGRADWCPTYDIADSMRVVDKLRERAYSYSCTICMSNDGPTRVCFTSLTSIYEASHRYVTMAICIAALKVFDLWLGTHITDAEDTYYATDEVSAKPSSENNPNQSYEEWYWNAPIDRAALTEYIQSFVNEHIAVGRRQATAEIREKIVSFAKDTRWFTEDGV